MTENAPMTKDGLEALRAELEQLTTTGRQDIAARIKTAREWGDLKENSEYHDAKNSQALLERRITLLDDQIRRAVVVEPVVTGEVVVFGSEVTVTDESNGRELTYTLVGAAEADLAAGRLSVDSPVARALLGKRAGQSVPIKTPRGQRQMRVDAIAPR